MGGEEDEPCGLVSGSRKTYWRSASWSASRTSALGHPMDCASGEKSFGANGQFRRCPPPLTPRSQSQKARSCLPSLQPLAIARRSLDEWPYAGSDDLEEWPQPPTPSAKTDPRNPDEALKLDLSSLRAQVKRDQIAFYDRECSKVAEHIYLGGDCVARNREILRQHGITHVLNCVGFVCPEYFKSDLVYKTLWLQDSPTEDITSILYDVFDYFEDVRQHKGKVFVHCCQGVSRSTSLVIAYLMWREGQSFDDAFEFVKSARRIANPNMGFACQLLQCQKRVHDIPLSPNFVLRMYRMAPHSSYDPLHLVPKMLNDPSPAVLDSRGAFIIHVFSLIYVWIGKNCDPVMEKDANDAAFQVVRYEKVQGPIVTIKEGEESLNFWEAFSTAPLSENGTKIGRELIESASRINVGERRVETYDVDFELFYKALTGGVVPPFSSPGQGQETHLPARENNWSILRRKFTSLTMCRVYSDSALARNRDPGFDGMHLLPAEVSISTPYLSPSSISSDSSVSSKCSSESPSDSPSTSSPPSLVPSPHSPNLPNNVLPPPKTSVQLSDSLEALKSCPVETYSQSKGLARSIAERRGSFSFLKLPTLAENRAPLLRKVLNISSSCRESLQEATDRTNDADVSGIGVPLSASSIGTVSRTNCLGAIENDSDVSMKQREDCVNQNDHLLPCSSGLADNKPETWDRTEPVIYRWPDLEKLASFPTPLDPKSVLFILTHNNTKNGEGYKSLHLWIGSAFEEINAKSLSSMDEQVITIDWLQVGYNFLESIALPKNLPIKVIKEQEMEKILQLIN